MKSGHKMTFVTFFLKLIAFIRTFSLSTLINFSFFKFSNHCYLSCLHMWADAPENVDLGVKLIVYRWQSRDTSLVSRVYYSFHLSLYQSSPVPPPYPITWSHLFFMPVLSEINQERITFPLIYHLMPDSALLTNFQLWEVNVFRVKALRLRTEFG